TSAASAAIYPLSLHDALPIFLLPTIKSRCVLQACPLPSEQASVQWLQQQQSDLSIEQCQTLLALASGSPLNAQKLLSADVLAIRDRKSTRLNSSHVSISYAVF